MTYAESQTIAHGRQLADSANSAEALARELDEIVHECEHAAQFSKEECDARLHHNVPEAMRYLQINIRAQRQADAAGIRTQSPRRTGVLMPSAVPASARTQT